MKIVFTVISGENLAAEFLSAFLKQKGHQTDIVFDPRFFDSGIFNFKKLAKFFDIKKEIAKEILSKKPDIVGFPIFTVNYQRALILAKEIKRLSPKTPIIFGGIHPTSVPDIVIKEKCVDYVCVGEGEYALLELLNNLNNPEKISSIKNLWLKNKNKIIKNPVRSLLKNLDKLPFPDKSDFLKSQPKYAKNEYYTISGRGCPFACTFCANNITQNVYQKLNRPPRKRSPQNVIDELVLAKKIYNIKKITFPDDVFVKDVDWLKEFTSLYKKKIKLPYSVLTHARFLSLPVAKLLKNSGCSIVGFGIQSASEKTRSKILNRFESNEQIRQAAINCHKVGLNFSIDHIFNLPTETLEHQIMAMNFYNELRPTYINSFWLQFFPRTEIIKSGIKEKMISQKDIPNIEKGLAPSAYFIALGTKDTLKHDQTIANVQFLFTLLPLFSQKFIQKLIDKKVYLLNFTPPTILIGIIKAFNVLKNGTAYVYIDTIKYIFFFSFKTLSIKLKYRYKWLKK